MKTIATHHPEKLSAIGSSKDDVPFGTIFTGIIFANLFYWGTNQYVIQRTLEQKFSGRSKGSFIYRFS